MPAATAPPATQRNRHMELKTPLGSDVLLITGFDGSEAISRYFEFDVACIAPKEKDIDFDRLIGQPMTVKFVYPGSEKQTRYFNGICKAVVQGESDITNTHYELELVPKLWLLEYKVQTRIFQHINVPEILKKVLQGIDVKFDLKGTYEPRDYCVQYYETDYWFASRLMEEEGIFFFFTHTENGHTMVLGDHPGAHTEVVYDPKVLYKNVIQEQTQEKDLISRLRKSQELTCGKVTLRDHSLELTGKNLEAIKEIQESVNVGKKTHKLKVADNGKLEIYQYPGEYAQRFDGVDRIGGDQPSDVQKIFKDNQRTAGIRMQEEAVRSIELWGRSTCRQFSSGHFFQMETLPNDKLTANMKPDGKYLLTSVTHEAVMPDEYSSGGTQVFTYKNKFTCIPFELPYRPGRAKFKPRMPGCQTATVVGPAGEEIFVDKYGRIKVQFHWDREGQKNADSSCWIRVGTNWCGRNWGVFFIPRIGQEVIVDYIEGDPDRPIIVGNVYNNDQMPSYELAKNKTRSWIKTNSTLGGVGFNELRFEDLKGKEQIFIHGERNEDIRIKNDCMEHIMHDRHLIVGLEKDGKKVGNQNEEVLVNKNLKIHKNQDEQIGGDYKLIVGGIDGPGNLDTVIKKDKKELIEGESDLIVKKDQRTKVEGNAEFTYDKSYRRDVNENEEVRIEKNQQITIEKERALSIGGSNMTSISKDDHLWVRGDSLTLVSKSRSLKVDQDQDIKVGAKYALDSGKEIHLKAGMKVIIEAGMQISIKGPGGFIDIGPAGVTIQGTMVKINSGGSAGSGSGASPKSPDFKGEWPQLAEVKKAENANPLKPTEADDDKTGHKSN